MPQLADLARRLGVSNLLAILGVLLIVIAVGQLAGAWWAVGLLGLVLIAMAYVAHVAEQSARQATPPAVGRSVQP